MNLLSTKILITGASGIIGFQLYKKFQVHQNFTVFPTYYEHPLPEGSFLDIRDKKSVENLFSKINPSIVIHCAALANVDLCEKEHNLADSLNVEGTTNLVNACKKIGSKFVHISTSYVFDGTKEKFSESDKPSPVNYYGLSKLHAEQTILDSGLEHLILRTDQPYDWAQSWQKTNSVIRVVKTLKSGTSLKEIQDWYNQPTFIPNFAEILQKLIILNQSGIFHVSGSDFLNRVEWSIAVAEIFGLDKKLIKPISSIELNLPAKRPNVHLDISKVTKKTGIDAVGVKDGASKMYSEYENNLDIL